MAPVISGRSQIGQRGRMPDGGGEHVAILGLIGQLRLYGGEGLGWRLRFGATCSRREASR
jgi:hypothetical protein